MKVTPRRQRRKTRLGEEKESRITNFEKKLSLRRALAFRRAAKEAKKEGEEEEGRRGSCCC